VSDKASKRGFDAALGLPDRLFAAAYRNGRDLPLLRRRGPRVSRPRSRSPSRVRQLFLRLRRTLDDVLAVPEVRAALA
jgi:hypothetical protein